MVIFMQTLFLFLVSGGTIHNLFENPDIANVDVLDTTTNTWTSTDPLPLARESPACMVTNVGGKQGILVTGGCNNNCLDHLDDTLFYDFSTEKWQVKMLLFVSCLPSYDLHSFEGYGSQIERSANADEDG